MTGFNQDLANKIQLNHDQIEIWYGQVDTWQQQVATNKLASENFANTATHQASLAYQWAANPENTPVAEGKFSSLHYARQSEEYAEASSANAYQTRQDSIDAENAKREALNSASAASISETHAADSATHAKISETAAAASAKDANLSKVSASASENNAGSAASSALASRDSAASSASMAIQQADRSENEADRSEAAADKINRQGIPIGAIMPYYGSSAPMGWLGLTRGAKISKADYQALFKHLTDQRKSPIAVNRQYTTTDGFWYGAAESGNYVLSGNNVARLGAVDNQKNEVINIVGTLPPSGICTTYHSLTDIPLPNDECFLPDAASNFIKGYEPTGQRPMGTFEQDAIRNITGSISQSPWINYEQFSNPAPAGCFSLGSMSGSGDVAGINSYGRFINFDASQSVPTASENVPKNLNCLWIIKAYDAVSDPEQLQAKAVIDQVNGNSSDILAINGDLDRIGYALLDFGTVNVNSNYVKKHNLGTRHLITALEIFVENRWVRPAWFDHYANNRPNYFGSNVGEITDQEIKVYTAKNGVVVGGLSNEGGVGISTSYATAPCRVHVWRVKG